MTREELLKPELVRAMQQHALDDFPNEAIGVVLRDGTYKRMKNNAGIFSTERASVCPDEWDALVVDDKVAAVFHSHPDHPFAITATDMEAQEAVALPFLMCATDGKGCTPVCIWGDQLEPVPLYGRTFHHGITDCYEFIRDWHWINRGRRLPQFSRDWGWWAKGKNLYQDGFPKARFHQVPAEEAREGDVVLFTVRSAVFNHGGVIDSPGLLGHHASSSKYYDPTKLSRRDPLSRWMNYNPMFLRHEDD